MVTAGLQGDGPVDSHCHLQLLSSADRGRALDEARAAGVGGFLVPAITLDDADGLLELAQSEKDVWCALGVHPHEASTWEDGHATRLEALLGEPGVVAIGECGLDFHYDRSPRDVQLRVMRLQWEMAMDAGLPVIVHSRDGNTALRSVLEDGRFDGLRGVFHSFASGQELASQALAAGFYLGFSGMVTFQNADNVRQVLPTTPADRMLLETDTPYLAPVPFRGTRNEPVRVVEVGKRVALEIGSTYDATCSQTTANFLRLFERAASGGPVW